MYSASLARALAAFCDDVVWRLSACRVDFFFFFFLVILWIWRCVASRGIFIVSIFIILFKVLAVLCLVGVKKYCFYLQKYWL